MKEDEKETIVLVDAPNLAFRMFFALERTNMRTAKGEPSWATYGFLKALFDIIDKTKAHSIIAAYDLPEPTFRHKEYEAYKANRPEEMPEDLQIQWPHIRESLECFNIPIYEMSGFEADDVIGTIAKKASKDNKKVVILTGDRDAFQLVDKNISILVPSKGELKEYNKEEVFEYWGIWPEQVIDFKALCGDPSDNIPGVRGVGEKTASKLLNEYKDLDSIYKNIEQITSKSLKEKLINGKNDAYMSKMLATIRLDVPIKFSYEHAKLDIKDVNEIINFLQKFEFNSFIKRLSNVLAPFNDGKPYDFKKIENLSAKKEEQMTLNFGGENISEPVATERAKRDVRIIDDNNKLNKLVSDIENKKFICVDLETDSVNSNACNIVGFAVAWFKDEDDTLEYSKNILSVYIPCGHLEGRQIEVKDIIQKLKPVFEGKEKLIIGQNLKFEMKILKRFGIDIGVDIETNIYDTMLASYVHNPDEKHGLKKQVERIFNYKMINIDELIGSGKKQLSMGEIAIDKVAEYAVDDAFYTLDLAKYYKSELYKPLSTVLSEIEIPLVPVLSSMELNGVKIDTSYLQELSQEINSKIHSLEKDIFAITEEVFNINSSQQLGRVLFEKLGLKNEGKITKTGQYSTDADTLEDLAQSDETGVIKKILEYRQLTKIVSTYTESLPTQINPSTGFIHCDFNQTITTTGRLSSSNPNLQNIPIRSEYGRKVRKAFISRFTNGVLLSADYSQIELRVLAHMTEDPVLMAAFQNNEDIHKRTAMEIFQVSEEQITDEMRSLGKTLNFALIYQQGPFATARQLHITQKEAQEFIDKYFSSFKKVKPYFENLLSQARKDGYVKTYFGRRRYFMNLNVKSQSLRREDERAACNAPLQGTAADLMKIAMININKKLKDFKSKLIIQVHDEIILDVYPEEEEEVSSMVRDVMENGHPLKVPLLVNVSIGKNWYEC